MFTDYLTLLLINMVAGLVLLAGFVYVDLHNQQPRHWAPGFIAAGVIALIFGVYMTIRWPLPGPFNITFGEMSTFFGILFLMAGISMAAGWSLLTVAVYAVFVGLAAIVIGIRIMNLHLTQSPVIAGIGFILTGLGGMAALPVHRFFRQNRPVRIIAALVLLVAAAIWALTGYGAYWMHLSGFAHYTPR